MWEIFEKCQNVGFSIIFRPRVSKYENPASNLDV